MTSFRQFVNRIGVIFNPSKTDTLYAEDANQITDAINNLEKKVDNEKIILPRVDYELKIEVPSWNAFYDAINGGNPLVFSDTVDFKIYHAPISDNRFLSLNPTIELMRYKRAKANLSGKNFVHPVHMNGSGAPARFNGEQWATENTNTGPLYFLIPPRTTEWAYTSTDIFERTPITFDIKEWKGHLDNLASTSTTGYPFPVLVSDWDSNRKSYYGSTGTTYKRKGDVFAFRLRCDNPAYANDNTLAPYFYGDNSDPFVVYPVLMNDGTDDYFVGFNCRRSNYPKQR